MPLQLHFYLVKVITPGPSATLLLNLPSNRKSYRAIQPLIRSPLRHTPLYSVFVSLFQQLPIPCARPYFKAPLKMPYLVISLPAPFGMISSPFQINSPWQILPGLTMVIIFSLRLAQKPFGVRYHLVLSFYSQEVNQLSYYTIVSSNSFYRVSLTTSNGTVIGPFIQDCIQWCSFITPRVCRLISRYALSEDLAKVACSLRSLVLRFENLEGVCANDCLFIFFYCKFESR